MVQGTRSTDGTVKPAKRGVGQAAVGQAVQTSGGAAKAEVAKVEAVKAEAPAAEASSPAKHTYQSVWDTRGNSSPSRVLASDLHFMPFKEELDASKSKVEVSGGARLAASLTQGLDKHHHASPGTFKV